MGRFKELIEKLTWSYVIVGILAGAAFFYFMLDQSELEMRQDSLKITAEEISNLEGKIQATKKFELEFETKKKNYAELVKKLQTLQGALPKQFYLPELLSELLREAKKLELEVLKIEADPSEKVEDLYNSLGFTLDLNGTFVQFFIFLDRLAHLNRILNVENFDINPAGKKITLGGEEGLFAGTKFTGGRTLYNQVNGRIRVITYRYKEKVAAPRPLDPKAPKKPGGA